MVVRETKPQNQELTLQRKERSNEAKHLIMQDWGGWGSESESESVYCHAVFQGTFKRKKDYSEGFTLGMSKGTLARPDLPL